MKLYEIYINNMEEYGDYRHDVKLVVAKDEDSAKVKADKWLKESYGSGYFELYEVESVDGYKINVGDYQTHQTHVTQDESISNMLECILCGNEFVDGEMHYSDTCDDCARYWGYDLD